MQGTFEVRCRTCRDRDQQAGGHGRADLLGILGEDGKWTPIRRETLTSIDDSTPSGSYIGLGRGKAKAVGTTSDWTVGGVRDRCRRRHRINAKPEDVKRAVEAAKRLNRDTVFLGN